MGCIYSDSDGICTVYDPGIENSGWNENGYCICEDDENPLESCEDYQSDDE